MTTRTSVALLLAPTVLALLACKLDELGGKKEAPPVATAPAPPPAPAPVPVPVVAAEPGAKAAAEPAGAENEALPAIPEGRSKPPTLAEWGDAKEVNTQEANSQPDQCFMKIVREWLKVNCAGDVTHVSDMDGFGKENVDFFQFFQEGKKQDFVVRLRPGRVMKVRIHRGKEKGASLFVNWPAGQDRPTHVALGALPE